MCKDRLIFTLEQVNLTPNGINHAGFGYIFFTERLLFFVDKDTMLR